MTVKNDTQDVTVSADVTIDDWNTWDNVVTADSIEVILLRSLLQVQC